MNLFNSAKKFSKEFLTKLILQAEELLLMVILLVVLVVLGVILKLEQSMLDSFFLIVLGFFLARVITIGLNEKTNKEIFEKLLSIEKLLKKHGDILRATRIDG